MGSQVKVHHGIIDPSLTAFPPVLSSFRQNAHSSYDAGSTFTFRIIGLIQEWMATAT